MLTVNLLIFADINQITAIAFHENKFQKEHNQPEAILLVGIMS